jgi:gluconate 5-dehydrogenase
MISDYLCSLFSLEDRVAVVTGAARGNGAAMAEALGRAGAHVVLVDRLPEELEATSDRLKTASIRCRTIDVDLSDPGSPHEIVSAVKRDYGKCDILVNNAGITIGGEPLSYPPEAWERTYAVNLRAPFLLSQALAKELMAPAHSGSIINITSLNAELAFPDNPAYVTFKGGLRSLTQSLALDLGKFGIRVNAIGPGYIHTAMTARSFSSPDLHESRRAHTALGRWGDPTDLAGAVLYLASDAAAYVTGISIYVDGGWLVKGL